MAKCVCLLDSLAKPGNRYVGVTTDIDKRMKEHNAGQSPHKARLNPWRLHVAMQSADDARADAFEQYLKSGSGHAFARRHLC